MQMFLFRELLGAIRTKSAVFFALSGFLLFLFLASVASFLMMTPGEVSSTTEGQPIEELQVYLSPTLSSATIDNWFLTWRERDDIARLRFQFAQELDNTASGGVFVVTPADTTQARALADEFRTMNGIVSVVEVPRVAVIETPTVSLVVRISLLVVLVLAVSISLICFRRGYRELLSSFSGEIRMLRLSGISERVLVILVVAWGVLIGFLGGLFVFAVLYLMHQLALTTGVLPLFGGLTHGLRILGAGLLVLALGTVLGGLAGLLGASLLHRREFDPLP
jgi:cell division protein FtsX